MPFEIVRNDITRMETDAVVNAANPTLLGGGGVDGAIHSAAGPELLEECRTLHGCETGQAKITKGYRLPAKYVIHTVGPVWRGGRHGERELLRSCYTRSLELAEKYQCESVAFPLISAGAYGYPGEEAMEVAVEAISSFLLHHDMTVYLVVFGRSAFFTGKKLFRDIKEYIDDVYAACHDRKRTERMRRLRWRENGEGALIREENLYGSVLANEAAPLPSAAPRAEMRKEPDWQALVRATDEGFSQALLRMIDERGMKDSECYRKANVDRRLFSKIRSDPEYRPSKPTVFAFVMALRLTLPEAKELLKKAGFALTRSSRMDLVMEYCIREQIYDVLQINEVLYELDLPLLGNTGSVA